MRSAALLFGVMACVGAASAVRAQVACPLTLPVETRAEAPDEAWSVDGARADARLVGVELLDGPPAAAAKLLRPDRERRGAREWLQGWTLKPNPRGRWLRCRYANTSVTLTRRVPDEAATCEFVRDRTSLAAKRAECRAAKPSPAPSPVPVPAPVPAPPPPPPPPNDHAPPPDGPASDAPDTVHRGLLTWTADAHVIETCGDQAAFWVADRSGELARIAAALNGGRAEPVFVEVRGALGPPPASGPGADYARQLNVHAVRRAAREGAACQEDLAFERRALGQEPSWSVRVAARGITLERPGVPALAFPHVAPRADGAASVYAVEAGGHALTLRLVPGRCTDTMSGALFPWTAEARIDGGTALMGCAYEGE